MAAAFIPATPAPDHHDPPRGHPGHPAEQHAPPALPPLQAVRPHLRRHPPRHLAHRREQRQRPVRELDGLVGHRADTSVEQSADALPVRGQVQIGEQRLVGAHPVVLGRLRLLHLEHQLRRAPHVVGRRDDLRAGRDVVLVGQRRPGAGLPLDQHPVAAADELDHAGRGDRHPVLADLQLPRDPDNHVERLPDRAGAARRRSVPAA
nr:hypothetical protein GCM10020241_53550 [Streptoalloteichus tenebrarius]